MKNSFAGPLPETFRRYMVAEQRKQLACPTNDDAQVKIDRKTELLMHHKFEAWCRLNLISYIHSRMDRKPTIREGWPDFTLFKNGRCCFVEFKVPGKGVTPKQADVATELRAKGFGVIVSIDVGEAMRWAGRQLEIL